MVIFAPSIEQNLLLSLLHGINNKFVVAPLDLSVLSIELKSFKNVSLLVVSVNFAHPPKQLGFLKELDLFSALNLQSLRMDLICDFSKVFSFTTCV